MKEGEKRPYHFFAIFYYTFVYPGKGEFDADRSTNFGMKSINNQRRPVPRAVVSMIELEVRRHPVRAFLPLYSVQPVERDKVHVAVRLGPGVSPRVRGQAAGRVAVVVLLLDHGRLGRVLKLVLGDAVSGVLCSRHVFIVPHCP